MKRSLGAKTLIHPTPTWIVGSYDKQGKPNGMTAAWGGICCSDPPCVAVSLRLVDAPYVQEFPMVLECQVLHVFDLGLHTQFVGQILDVKADEEVLDTAGMPDVLKVLPIVFSPGNQLYYGIGEALGQAFATGKEI